MINGKTLARAILSGINEILNKKQMIDELNVFPVPDGDTGTNMSMTMNACKMGLELLENPTVDKVSDLVASSLLRGARGNSGVILSLLFRGFAKSLKGKEQADGNDLAQALLLGVEEAYKAVMKPTEGTILTVARVSAEQAQLISLTENDFLIVFKEILKTAKETLDKTPELLPVLKKAGVVDAGGMGFVVILEGMYSVLENDIDVELVKSLKTTGKITPVLNAVTSYDNNIDFGYCTEFIIVKQIADKDPIKLRARLETIGDSVVCVEDDDIIKIHVHTNNPGLALEEGIKYGFLIDIKIDNMRTQHQAKVTEANLTIQDNAYLPVDPDKKFGFVAVAAGEGLENLFYDLGVDKIVSGGQTMNPSTDDILRAILSTPAQTVFVLPNNKNIIMAAEQTIKLADRRVCVLQTTTIPQGITAMLSFDDSLSYKDNRVAMTKSFDTVQTGLITYAARDSDFDGHVIKQGEILAIENGKLAFTNIDIEKAIIKLTKSLSKKSVNKYITLIYGVDVTDEQAQDVYDNLVKKIPDTFEINLINGGQPVYYYMLSVE